MNRTTLISIVLAAVPFAVACQKTAADDQAKAREAQEQANQEIGRANLQASEAQRKANEKIAAAEADFVVLRENYRLQTLSNLDALDLRIQKLDLKAVGPGDNAVLKAALPAIHAQRQALDADVRALDAASSASFDATRARLDQEMADLKAAVDKAR